MPHQKPDREDEFFDEGEVNPDEKTMTFLEHLEELRWVLLKVLIAFLVGFVLVAAFLDNVANLLRWPLDFGVRENPEVLRLVTTTPLAIFTVFMMVCFLGAVAFSMPFVLYFVGQFVAPALTPKEKKLLVPGLVLAVLLFLAGMTFAFFLLVPSVIRVSVYFNALLGYEVIWSADKYYSMLAWMCLGMGTAFQFPMVLQILLYLGVVTVEKLRSWRRIMILVCFVVAAVITPTPDPLNMTIVALPLILLYEVAIWIGATYTVRHMEAARSELEEDEDEPV